MLYIIVSVIHGHHVSVQNILHFHSCYHLLAPGHFLPTPLLLPYSQAIFPQKELRTLDDIPIGFGKKYLATTVHT